MATLGKQPPLVLAIAGGAALALLGGIATASTGAASDSGKKSTLSATSPNQATPTAAATTAPAPAPTTAAAVVPTGPAAVTDAASLQARIVPPTTDFSVSTDDDAATAVAGIKTQLGSTAGVAFAAAEAYESSSSLLLVVAAHYNGTCPSASLVSILKSEMVTNAKAAGSTTAVGSTTDSDGTSEYAAACTGNTLVLSILGGDAPTQAEVLMYSLTEVTSISS